MDKKGGLSGRPDLFSQGESERSIESTLNIQYKYYAIRRPWTAPIWKFLVNWFSTMTLLIYLEVHARLGSSRLAGCPA